MNAMFAIAKSFNQPIGDWNVSNVEDMSQMFLSAESFNQPIGDWDVANVTSMHEYDLISKHRDLGEKIDLIDSILNELTDSEENDRFLSSWSTQELRGIHNLFKAIIFEAYPMTDEKHKARLRAMIGFFQMAYCSNQNTYLFVDDKDYQNFVKEIQLDKILPSKEGIDSLRDLNKRKKNELLFMATILITQSDVGWDEVYETKEFNLIRKLLAIIQWDENSYNKMYEIY
ncbi:BspA family leucine-rich repeat surface protein, partial [Polaribacter sp.]|nr:BspA family leucine-rich repeat surface protein [Polaribacter sp.]